MEGGDYGASKGKKARLNINRADQMKMMAEAGGVAGFGVCLNGGDGDKDGRKLNIVADERDEGEGSVCVVLEENDAGQALAIRL